MPLPMVPAPSTATVLINSIDTRGLRANQRPRVYRGIARNEKRSLTVMAAENTFPRSFWRRGVNNFAHDFPRPRFIGCGNKHPRQLSSCFQMNGNFVFL